MMSSGGEKEEHQQQANQQTNKQTSNQSIINFRTHEDCKYLWPFGLQGGGDEVTKINVATRTIRLLGLDPGSSSQ